MMAAAAVVVAVVLTQTRPLAVVVVAAVAATVGLAAAVVVAAEAACMPPMLNSAMVVEAFAQPVAAAVMGNTACLAKGGGSCRGVQSFPVTRGLQQQLQQFVRAWQPRTARGQPVVVAGSCLLAEDSHSRYLLQVRRPRHMPGARPPACNVPAATASVLTALALLRWLLSRHLLLRPVLLQLQLVQAWRLLLLQHKHHRHCPSSLRPPPCPPVKLGLSCQLFTTVDTTTW